ncbi:hypothetical protein [Desulfonatronum thiodismutans]|uniref:hypothetical protein n=1 Tax=Desulfonatronum thiodismutans TaxID=159290 RepID=UPI0004ABD47E|nr:hypothetical protein [Desulfonatronum thiodismutans]
MTDAPILNYRNTFGFVAYGSILANSITKGDHGDRTGSRFVYNFRKSGKQSERVKALVEGFRTLKGCKSIAVIPGHTPAPTQLQQLFGVTIRRRSTVPDRNRKHHQELPKGYGKSFVIPKDLEFPVLLLDDLFVSGRTMEHFRLALERRGHFHLGSQVVCLALGIDHKLNPEPTGETIAIETPRPGQKSPKLRIPKPEPQDAPQDAPVDIPMDLAPANLTEEGLDAALARLRWAEKATFAAFQEARDGKSLKAWSGALDLLRKLEGNVIEVLQSRRELLPASEVKTWLGRQIDAAKSSLLDLPGRLAPGLEGLPWPEMQKIMEREIREALRGLSNQP